MKIFVRKLNGDTIPVTVEGLDTVEQFRIEILKKEGVPPEQQRLMHRRRKLKDGRTLRSYGIEQGCIVYLMVGFVGGKFPAPILKHSIVIFILEPRMMYEVLSIPIMADGSDSVEVLKLYVLEKTSVPPDRQRLIYRRQKLQNGRTLRSYDITYGSTVCLEIMNPDGFLVPHLEDGRMKVLVKGLSGRTTSLDVEDSCTIEGLKFKILQKEHIYPSAQRLIFRGEQLEDARTLNYYNVSHLSTVHLVLRLAGGGPGDPFVDLENKDAMQRIDFTYVKQGRRWWSMVNSGLNIEGKCTQTSCDAHGRRVILQMGYGVFNVITDDVRCPFCKGTIKAISCGFTDCEWTYTGRKKGSDATINSEWHVAGHYQYERFREAGNTIDWDVLIIEAKTNPRLQCRICLYDVCSFDEPQSLACGCRFHSDCVASWKTRETHCPTCRAEICEESPIASLESRLEINCMSPSPQHNGSLSSREMCHKGETMPGTKNHFRRLLSRLGLLCN